MRCKLLNEATDGQRVFAVVLETGDEAMASLGAVAWEQRLGAAQITGIGAFRDAVLAYFDWDDKRYIEMPVDEQVEVASLIGDIGVDDAGEPALHVHLVLGRRDGSAIAGHLVRAHVRPTLELLLTESPAHLQRRRDPETGLNLIKL